MATPAGHTLTGLILYRAIEKKGSKLLTPGLLFFVIMSNLSDLDYVPGLLMGNAHAFHRGFTHTLFFVLLVSGLSAWVGPWMGLERQRAAWIGGLCCLSHLVIDLFTADWKAPYGVPLFWPFLERTFISPVALFLPPSKGSLRDLFQPWNLLVVFMECVVLIPFLFLLELKAGKDGRREVE